MINNETGRIVTRQVFDRDEPSRQKELYVTVKASDNGKPPLADVCTFKVIILDVNDNAPTFDTSVSFPPRAEIFMRNFRPFRSTTITCQKT